MTDGPDADGLVWDDRPQLRSPVLVAAFEGWNDAADAASTAVTWLISTFEASRFAWIDPEMHIDFQSRRPVVELVDGVIADLVWPANEFLALRTGDSSPDLVALCGVEPNMGWRSFCRAVLSVASAIDARMVVTLGALIADVPHTRPVAITGAATDPAVAQELGLATSRYEGPTGIVGVLQDTCRQRGMVSASLWVPVPHYVASPPNPMATRALLDRFGALAGLSLDLGDLDELGTAWRRRVDEVVSEDDSVRDYIQQLEARVDAEAATADVVELATGDEIAAELEQFLRDQDES